MLSKPLDKLKKWILKVWELAGWLAGWMAGWLAGWWPCSIQNIDVYNCTACKRYNTLYEYIAPHTGI